MHHGTFISLTCKNLTSDNVKSFTNVKIYVTSSTSFHLHNTIRGERWVDMTYFGLEKTSRQVLIFWVLTNSASIILETED